MSASRRLSTRTGPLTARRPGARARAQPDSEARHAGAGCEDDKQALRRVPETKPGTDFEKYRRRCRECRRRDGRTTAGRHPRPSLTDRRSPRTRRDPRSPLRVTRRERATGWLLSERLAERTPAGGQPRPRALNFAPASINPDGRIAPTPMDDAPVPATPYVGRARLVVSPLFLGGRAKRRGDPFCGGGRLPTPDRQKLGRADRKSLHNRGVAPDSVKDASAVAKPPMTCAVLCRVFGQA